MRRAASIAVFGAAGSVLLSSCAGSPSLLDSHGARGADITTLWWLMFWIAAAVCVIITILLIWATTRARSRPAEPDLHAAGGTSLVLWGGAIIPAILLVGVFSFVLKTMVAEAGVHDPGPITIKVIGHRWWWEFDYMKQHVDTANELHVPAGRAVTLKITSVDVIHSFWVPQIQEKTDAIPGRINTVAFQANKVGTNLGECAEYCGMQHANMDFLVVAQPPAEFQHWLRSQQKPAPVPKTALQEAGQQVFLGSACVYCHTIKGTNASGNVGPDLTHFAGRKSIGAGILPNTPGNLAGWIANSQSIKPGNAMPPMDISGNKMQALLAYMETLK